jgi:hypothetical protein
MSTIFARLTLLLVGADACTPHIINSVLGEDDDTRLALGGPHGDLSLIWRRLLTLSKLAINTVHIWLTDPSTPILAHTSDSYNRLPSTLRQLLLHSSNKLVFAREPVPRGTESINLAKLPNTDSRVGSSHSLALAISDGEYLNSLPRGKFFQRGFQVSQTILGSHK